MATKDFYSILGIPRSASGSSIRAAFHALAKKLHPDHAGPQSARAFRDVLEAYEVLSDPARRREYNATLVSDRRAQSLGRPAGFARERMFREPEPAVPFLEEVLALLAGSFGVGLPGSYPRTLDLAVVLTPQEALRGTVLPIEVPVRRACPWCGGSGRDWQLPCPSCDRGWCWQRETMGIPIPAGVRAGRVLDVSLRQPGIRDLCLRIHVRVEG